jgi:hypothetical protein
MILVVQVRKQKKLLSILIISLDVGDISKGTYSWWVGN